MGWADGVTVDFVSIGNTPVCQNNSKIRFARSKTDLNGKNSCRPFSKSVGSKKSAAENKKRSTRKRNLWHIHFLMIVTFGQSACKSIVWCRKAIVALKPLF
jgi:hypothetical protein